MREIEAKVKVSRLAPVREKLKSLGATFKEVEQEENLIFDREPGTWKTKDTVLRLRKGNRVSLTYKGPQEKGPLKIRPEYQVDVSDFAMMKRILDALGFQCVFTYLKRREDYAYKGCAVSLDEVEGLGTFVEVEGPSEGQVLTVLKELGFGQKEAIKDSYVKLLLLKGKKGKMQDQTQK